MTALQSTDRVLRCASCGKLSVFVTAPGGKPCCSRCGGDPAPVPPRRPIESPIK